MNDVIKKFQDLYNKLVAKQSEIEKAEQRIAVKQVDLIEQQETVAKQAEELKEKEVQLKVIEDVAKTQRENEVKAKELAARSDAVYDQERTLKESIKAFNTKSSNVIQKQSIDKEMIDKEWATFKEEKAKFADEKKKIKDLVSAVKKG